MTTDPDLQKLPLLQTKSLTRYFGGLAAVVGLDIKVFMGEIIALIGPNGAGKTTTFKLMTGFLRPTSGHLYFQGRDITGLGPHRVARLGLVRSFQANVLFMEKTALENVQVGFYLRSRGGVAAEILNLSSHKTKQRAMTTRAEEILDFFGLISIGHQKAGNLPHGHQRLLGMAVALASGPKLMLLDEPVAGMNDEETAATMMHIRRIRDQGVTILLVEHDMKAVMSNAERIVVMEHGQKIAEGAPAEIAANEQVIQAYLGGGEFLDAHSG